MYVVSLENADYQKPKNKKKMTTLTMINEETLSALKSW